MKELLLSFVLFFSIHIAWGYPNSLEKKEYSSEIKEFKDSSNLGFYNKLRQEFEIKIRQEFERVKVEEVKTTIPKQEYIIELFKKYLDLNCDT